MEIEENVQDLANVSTDESDDEQMQARTQLIVDDKERDLESRVFGASDGFLFGTTAKTVSKAKNKKHGKKVKKLKEIAEHFEKRSAAWKDEDDDTIVDVKKLNKLTQDLNTQSNVLKTNDLEESLKAKYMKYYGTPLWADLDKTDEKKSKEEDDEAESDTELFHHTSNFLSKSQFLPKGIIDIKSCTDANKEDPHKAKLKCVEFHPSARVLLTAGLNQTLTLFQIDGKKNPKIQSIFIDKFPILGAHFTKNGEQIIIGSRHKSFYYYDMIAGKIVNVPAVKALEENKMASFEISPDNTIIAFIGSFGNIHLFSAKSKEWIDSLKVNDQVNAVTFSPDSRYLFAFGNGKDVHVFDMNERGHKSLHRFNDFGCLSGTSITVANNSQYIATGCKSGVVNIYNYDEALKSQNPKPLKSFMNLTTPCTSLKFNCSSEILATCSSHAENAFKLIHVSSLSVFSNFPSQQEAMRIPVALDFSLNSGYITIANHKGAALLYRLKHYGSF